MKAEQMADYVTKLSRPTELSKSLKIHPDPWQTEFMDDDNERIILCCGRQVGKSTAVAMRILHRLFTPERLILITSPSERQSKMLFYTVKQFASQIDGMPAAVEDTKLSLMLDNGSNVVALPGTEKSIRGFASLDTLVVDEAARVEDSLYMAVEPMVAISRGTVILLSTPFGKRGFFWEIWDRGKTWSQYHVTAYDCPRYSEEWLAEKKEITPDLWFRQEYLAEFVDAENQLFSMDDIQAAFKQTLKPLDFGDVKTSGVKPLEV